MKIESTLEETVVTSKVLMINIDPKDKDSLVKTLKDIMKKAKPDRLEEYIVNRLINALENPEPPRVLEQSSTPEQFSYTPHQPKSRKPGNIIKEADVPIDKKEIVSRIKKRVGTVDGKTVAQFMEESIAFGQKKMGIATRPKDGSEEAFYDWLLESGIIDANGMPIGNK